MMITSAIRPKPRKTPRLPQNTAQVFVFETELGWIGVFHIGLTLQRIKLGYRTRQELIVQLGPQNKEIPFEEVTDLNLFHREVIEAFSRFASGEREDFFEFEVDQTSMTPFQRSVTDACRSIPYGETVSYGELAKIAGSPRAARAVGSVMSNNPYPLVVPCHRVVSSGGRLGGFSAPRGTTLKKELLQLEQAEGFFDSRESV